MMKSELDAAWEKINAIGGYAATYDDFGHGINNAVEQALAIIEELGGMSPLRRAEEMTNEQVMDAGESNESAPTPGPWTFAQVASDEWYIEGADGSEPASEVWSEADARLIAQAPRLLLSLIEAVEFQNEDTECLGDGSPDEEVVCPDSRCRDHGCMVDKVNEWRAAIALALGGAS